MNTAKHRRPGDAAQFYDALAEYYDLIFEDWDASMARQGAALETVTRYFAVSMARLLALMGEAGFTSCRRLDEIIYQPVLIGRAR